MMEGKKRAGRHGRDGRSRTVGRLLGGQEGEGGRTIGAGKGGGEIEGCWKAWKRQGGTGGMEGVAGVSDL
jgi:hypothetical protein